MGKGDPQGGRPTKLTQDVHDLWVELMSEGVPYVIATKACGISTSTLDRWLKQGESDHDLGLDTDHSKFWEASARAVGGWARRMWHEAQTAQNGAEAQPRQWAITTRMPQLHLSAQVKRLELSGPDGGPIKTESKGEILGRLESLLVPEVASGEASSILEDADEEPS